MSESFLRSRGPECTVPVKLMQIPSFADRVHVDLGILGNLVDVTVNEHMVSTPAGVDKHNRRGLRLEKILHIGSQGSRVDIPHEPCSLQSERAGLEIPRIGEDDGGFEYTVTSFLANVLQSSDQNQRRGRPGR